MACERYRDALTDVAAGEAATVAVEGHLVSCEACRAELLVLRRALAVADAGVHFSYVAADGAPLAGAELDAAARSLVRRIAVRVAAQTDRPDGVFGRGALRSGRLREVR